LIQDQTVLEIRTLGNFQVSYGEKILTQEYSRSYRLWKIFKYLITYREQGVLPEVLVEKIWPDEDYADAKSAVRTQVHRLRQLLTSATGINGSDFILFNHGSYQWNKECKYWLDADQFEQLCQQAQNIKQENPSEAITLLQKAVALYVGEYLPEEAYSEWAIIQRQYYNRLYLEAVVTLGDLLKDKGQYNEIITLCEKAMNIEPCVEEIHIHYIDALLAQGKKKLAISHFGRISETFCREMGIKPFSKMSHLYQVIQGEGGIAEHDLTLIQEDLQRSPAEAGAFFCDPIVFRSMYQLEQRRKKQNITVGLFTLIGIGPNGLQIRAESMKHLKEVLASCLRKTDVFTRWNDSQFIAMLYDTDYDKADKKKIIEKIENCFWATCKWDNERLTLFSKLQPFLPAQKQK